MNREDFRLEIHKYIDEAYNDYVKYQNVLREVFAETHRICVKHNIEYYLAYGSLLGFIRDKDDIIPWDYDYDIIVPIRDISKLIYALNNDLGDDYYYVSNFTTKKYPYNQIRICKKGYDESKSHVDIFYMMGAPSDIRKQEKLTKKFQKIFMYRMASFNTYRERKLNINPKIINLGIKTIRFFLGHIHSEKYFDNIFKMMTKKYDYDISQYVLIVGENSMIFPKNLFVQKKVSLGYTDAYIPEQYDEFLKMVYGDYKKYAPIKERFKEFYHGYRYISD